MTETRRAVTMLIILAVVSLSVYLIGRAIWACAERSPRVAWAVG